MAFVDDFFEIGLAVDDGAPGFEGARNQAKQGGVQGESLFVENSCCGVFGRLKSMPEVAVGDEGDGIGLELVWVEVTPGE